MFRSFLRKGNVRQILPRRDRELIQLKEETINRIEEELSTFAARIKRSIHLQETVIAKGTQLAKQHRALSAVLQKYLDLDTEPKTQGGHFISLFSSFCLIQQDSEQGLYTALQSKFIGPAQTLLRHFELRQSFRKAWEQSRKAYQDAFAKATTNSKKSKPKDHVKTFQLSVEANRAENVYLDRLDECYEVYLALKSHAELEMTYCVISLARALMPVNQTKLQAMHQFGRKMDEAKSWASVQRQAYERHLIDRSQAQADALQEQEGRKYESLVNFLAKGTLFSALAELGSQPEMGTVSRVILPHIYRILKAHGRPTTSLAGIMQPEFVSYAEEQPVSTESVFEQECPSVANFLRSNFQAICAPLVAANNRETILELAATLGPLFCKKTM